MVGNSCQPATFFCHRLISQPSLVHTWEEAEAPAPPPQIENLEDNEEDVLWLLAKNGSWWVSNFALSCLFFSSDNEYNGYNGDDAYPLLSALQWLPHGLRFAVVPEEAHCATVNAIRPDAKSLGLIFAHSKNIHWQKERRRRRRRRRRRENASLHDNSKAKSRNSSPLPFLPCLGRLP